MNCFLRASIVYIYCVGCSVKVWDSPCLAGSASNVSTSREDSTLKTTAAAESAKMKSKS